MTEDRHTDLIAAHRREADAALASLGLNLAGDLSSGQFSMSDAIQMIEGLAVRLAALSTPPVQQEGEPAAWRVACANGEYFYQTTKPTAFNPLHVQPLYAAPVQPSDHVPDVGKMVEALRQISVGADLLATNERAWIDYVTDIARQALSHPAHGKEGQGSSVAESASTPVGRTEGQGSDGMRDISTAPRDGTPILARMSQLDDGSRWTHLSGRWFVVRHDGQTVSDYDMGWSVYPGLGGAPDKWFAGWLPLPAQDDRVATAWHDGFIAALGCRPWEAASDFAILVGQQYARGEALPPTMPRQVLAAQPWPPAESGDTQSEPEASAGNPARDDPPSSSAHGKEQG